MKPFIIIGVILGLNTLPACHWWADNEDLMEGMELGICASVVHAENTRTITDGGHTEFMLADEIGFFMPDEEKPVCWTNRGEGDWSSEIPLYWPDKESVFEFSAFYPYEKSAVRNYIPLPNLGMQKGNWEDVDACDFLLASTSCSYATSLNGKVAFVGSSAFKHLYSLIVIILKEAEGGSLNTTLTHVLLEGKNMVKEHYYDLALNKMCAVEESDEGNRLEWDVLPGNGNLSSAGVQLVFLINPSEIEQTIRLVILYEKNGMKYQAETSAIRALFKSGKLYKYSINIKNGGLNINGSDIVDWEEGADLGDIIIDGIPE